MKMKRIDIVVVFLALILAVSTFYSFQAYHAHQNARAQTRSMTARLQMLQQQSGIFEQKIKSLQHAHRFMNHTAQLGLTPARWDQYDVAIENDVTFEELAQIIMQCNRQPDLYFRPVVFEIKIASATEANPTGDGGPAGASADLARAKGKDVRLKLNGTFVVKR